MNAVCALCRIVRSTTKATRLSCVHYPKRTQQLHTTMVTNVGGSGKFKKMKAKPDSYFQRKSVEEESNQNFLFSRNYLDSTVSKLLSSERRNKYSFLRTTRQSLQEEEANIRENVTRDWNHISETVQDLGIPEFADVIGGQMFAGGHVRETTTCCLTLRLADNLRFLEDSEVITCLQDISVWPSDVSSSETLTAVFKSIDKELSHRCPKWDTVENIRYALIWSRGPARTAEKLFEKKVLELASKDILNFSMDDCVAFLLLCSYESNIASELVLGEEEKYFLESQILQGLHSLSGSKIYSHCFGIGSAALFDGRIRICILAHSVVDPYGSVSFGQIRIHFRRYRSGSGKRQKLTKTML